MLHDYVDLLKGLVSVTLEMNELLRTNEMTYSRQHFTYIGRDSRQLNMKCLKVVLILSYNMNWHSVITALLLKSP